MNTSQFMCTGSAKAANAKLSWPSATAKLPELKLVSSRGRRGGILETVAKVRAKADEIVQKWIDYFVLRRDITPVTITRRLP